MQLMRGKKLAVVGDLVADLYVMGETSRISREAPVLVLRYEGEEYRPGGAANAVMNGAALGGNVRAIGCVGADAAGAELIRMFRKVGADVTGVVVAAGRPTATKTRVLAGGRHTSRQQVIRIDRVETAALKPVAEQAVRRHLTAALKWADAVLISDYGLGLLSDAALRGLASTFRRRRLVSVVDSRRRLLAFRNMTMATPNEEEGEQAASALGAAGPAAKNGERLRQRLTARSLLLTRGGEGMSLFEKGRPAIHLAVHGTKDATDVTGAGDTVASCAALAMAAGASPSEAASLANVAAGIVVTKHGAATTNAGEILAALRG